MPDESKLHLAVCRVVALLNTSPDAMACKEARQARDLLRIALEEYGQSNKSPASV